MRLLHGHLPAGSDKTANKGHIDAIWAAFR